MLEKTKNHIANYNELLKDARADLKNAINNGGPINSKKGYKISISKNNSKMGDVTSISLLPLITCPAICNKTCAGACYADKIATLYKTVAKAYARNTAAALDNPEMYFSAITRHCKNVGFFRWHVSGDIINRKYFENMIETAKNTPNCTHLAFTKRYKVVNDYLKDGGIIPENLKIIFSAWGSYSPANPYNLPVSNFYDETNPAPKKAQICGGNCFECAINGGGCWTLKNGEMIVFKKH